MTISPDASLTDWRRPSAGRREGGFRDGASEPREHARRGGLRGAAARGRHHRHARVHGAAAGALQGLAFVYSG